ncbi:DUF4369 domain-containing protein [Dysgonomonas sp. 520]|uniref:DUF4369 domain-containing protein n=1 Tax=Dysgonomonas sp. 520 TaxID=2302931 RepID=UPI001C869012
MKNIYKPVLVCFILSFAILSCKEKKIDESYTIEGRLSNIEKPYVILATQFNQDSIVVDTIKVDEKGHFSYKGNVDTLYQSYLYLDDDKKMIPVFLNKRWNIKINGDVNTPELMTVKGGDVNDDLTKFKEENKALIGSLLELNKALNDTSETNGIAKQAELKNVEFELSGKAKQYIQNNPDKIASVLLIEAFFKKKASVEVLTEELDKLKGDAASYYLTEELKAYSEYVKRSQIGSSAPYFSLSNLNGTEVNLSKYKGKYLLLAFVSSTCEFCEADVPYTKEVFSKLKKSKYDIVFSFIYIDSKNDSIKKDVASFPKEWVVLSDTGGWTAESIKLYNITGIPSYILISPEGLIVDRDFSITSLPDIMDKLKEEKEKDK